MSFHRISYLESWEHNPSAFRGQQSPPTDSHEEDGEDDEDTYQGLPDLSVSSSFPSTFSYPPLSRRLSFNPVAGPGWNESTVEDTASVRDRRPDVAAETGPSELALEGPEIPLPETKGAFEIGHRRRIGKLARASHSYRSSEIDTNIGIVQVCTAVVYCFLAAGTVFGFAAIKPIFIKEGVYRNLCSPDEINQNVSVCYGQELRYYPIQTRFLTMLANCLQSELNVHHSRRRNQCLGLSYRHNPRYLWSARVRDNRQLPVSCRVSSSMLCPVYTPGVRRIYDRVLFLSLGRTIHIHLVVSPLECIPSPFEFYSLDGNGCIRRI